MFQIIAWMLCFYFVLKTGEWWLIANASPPESRTANQIIASIMAVIAIGGAMAFVWLTQQQVDGMAQQQAQFQTSLSKLP
jgi:uncharacterized protein HemX